MNEKLTKDKDKDKLQPNRMNVFPLWVLLIILGIIIAIGLFLNWRIVHVRNNGQNFGFNFY
jgi:hypothetical protein